MDNICMRFNHLALFMRGQFCQYLILLLCNTSNTCLSIDPTVLDRFLEMPKNPIATLAWVTLLSWLLLHRPWWCWRCLLWNANDTMLTFKMIIVDDKILIVIRCSKTFCNFNCQHRSMGRIKIKFTRGLTFFLRVNFCWPAGWDLFCGLTAKS